MFSSSFFFVLKIHERRDISFIICTKKKKKKKKKKKGLKERFWDDDDDAKEEGDDTQRQRVQKLVVVVVVLVARARARATVDDRVRFSIRGSCCFVVFLSRRKSSFFWLIDERFLSLSLSLSFSSKRRRGGAPVPDRDRARPREIHAPVEDRLGRKEARSRQIDDARRSRRNVRRGNTWSKSKGRGGILSRVSAPFTRAKETEEIPRGMGRE